MTNKDLKRMIQLMGIKKPINESTSNSAVELEKKSPNGKIYGIVRENKKYFIKESNDGINYDYIGGLGNKTKNQYQSYEEAVKRLNIMFEDFNRTYGIEENNNILSSDFILEKKFILKSKKKKSKPAEEPSFDTEEETEGFGEEGGDETEEETEGFGEEGFGEEGGDETEEGGEDFDFGGEEEGEGEEGDETEEGEEEEGEGDEDFDFGGEEEGGDETEEGGEEGEEDESDEEDDEDYDLELDEILSKPSTIESPKFRQVQEYLPSIEYEDNSAEDNIDILLNS